MATTDIIWNAILLFTYIDLPTVLDIEQLVHFFKISSHCAWKGMRQIMHMLVHNQQSFIRLPTTEEFPLIARDFHRKSPSVYVVGAIDGTFI